MKRCVIILLLTLVYSNISFAQDEHKLKPIQKDYKYGYGYDENNGIFTIPPKYDDAQYFQEGLASVKIGDKWGFINEQGVTVISLKFDYAGYFVNGYASVGMNGPNGKYKYGIINKTGVLVIPCKYDGLGDVQEGMISAAIGNKMGFINIKGVVVIPMKFDCTPSMNMTDFSNGFAKVQVGNKVEFIDKTGKVIAPAKYPYARDFVEGMAAVGKDTNWKKYTSDGSKITKAWGFINTSGQDIISCQYENVSDFEKGKAKAYGDGYTWEIDKTGKIIDTLSKPAKRYVAALDSTITTGRINRIGRLTIIYNGGFIKSVTMNGTPVYNVSKSPINIDTKKMGLKAGSKATVKIVYTKGTTVKFLTGQGLE